MRFFTLLALLCLLVTSVQGQPNCINFPVLNNGFEEFTAGSCNDYQAFNLGCVSPWFASHGRPNLVRNGSALATQHLGNAHGGNNYAGLRAVFQNDAPGSEDFRCRNNALILPLGNVITGRDYTVTLYIRAGEDSGNTDFIRPLDFEIHQTSGRTLQSNPSTLSQCVDLDLGPDSERVFFLDNYSDDDWEEVQFTFRATGENDQLLFTATQERSGLFGGYYQTWILLDDISIVECDPCAGVDLTGFFGPSIPTSGQLTYNYQPDVDSDNFNDYDELNGESEWIVLTSTNNNPSGPFSLVGIYTDHTAFPPFSYGTLYTIIHRMTTDCGSACYIRNVCESCFRNGGKVNGEVIDCSRVDEIIDDVTPDCPQVAPTGLTCYDTGRETELTWTAVPGATQYQIEFAPTSGGPCCSPGPCPVNTLPEIVTTNSIVEPASLPMCYKWRVRTFCGNKPAGPWSAYRVQDGRICEPKGGGEGCPWCPQVGRFRTAQIYPNPSSNEFTIDFREFSESEVNIEIFDATGRMVHSSSTQQIDKYTWTPALTNQNGIYLIRIKDGSETSMHKVVLQR